MIRLPIAWRLVRNADQMMNITTAGLAHTLGQLEPDCELAVERVWY